MPEAWRVRASAAPCQPPSGSRCLSCSGLAGLVDSRRGAGLCARRHVVARHPPPAGAIAQHHRDVLDRSQSALPRQRVDVGGRRRLARPLVARRHHRAAVLALHRTRDPGRGSVSSRISSDRISASGRAGRRRSCQISRRGSPPTGAFSWRRLSSEHNGVLGFLFSVTLFSVGVEVMFGRRPLADWRADHWVLVAALIGGPVAIGCGGDSQASHAHLNEAHTRARDRNRRTEDQEKYVLLISSLLFRLLISQRSVHASAQFTRQLPGPSGLPHVPHGPGADSLLRTAAAVGADGEDRQLFLEMRAVAGRALELRVGAHQQLEGVVAIGAAVFEERHKTR